MSKTVKLALVSIGASIIIGASALTIATIGMAHDAPVLKRHASIHPPHNCLVWWITPTHGQIVVCEK